MNLRKILRLLLLAVFLVSTGALLLQLRDNAGGSESYSMALSIATGSSKKTASPEEETVKTEPEWIPEPITDDENLDAMADINIAALQEVNPDVVGWIRIPGTRVDYPIVQGTDNEHYLKHTWDGKQNSVGSIFMEHRNTPDFTDYNTILYGHNMNDGSMFANIKRYSTQWYWERHPYIYIATEPGAYRYEVFSSYEAAIDSPAYGLSFWELETKANFLETALRDSQAFLGIQPAMTDRVLTLSTCSGADYNHRWVLHARVKMIEGTGSMMCTN